MEGATTFDAMQKTLHSLISYQTRPPWRLRFILDKTSSWGKKKTYHLFEFGSQEQGGMPLCCLHIPLGVYGCETIRA